MPEITDEKIGELCREIAVAEDARLRALDTVKQAQESAEETANHVTHLRERLGANLQLKISAEMNEKTLERKGEDGPRFLRTGHDSIRAGLEELASLPDDAYEMMFAPRAHEST